MHYCQSPRSFGGRGRMYSRDSSSCAREPEQSRGQRDTGSCVRRLPQSAATETHSTVLSSTPASTNTTPLRPQEWLVGSPSLPGCRASPQTRFLRSDAPNGDGCGGAAPDDSARSGRLADAARRPKPRPRRRPRRAASPRRRRSGPRARSRTRRSTPSSSTSRPTTAS
jgi:hypothetical protein